MSPQMPRRPKQHRSEARSRLAFQQALPNAWVFRDPGQDYGLDGEVEIFDEDFATGLKFYVQLKASATRLDLVVSEATLNYYDALDLPVLLLLHSGEDALYCSWAHELDPLEARKGKKGLTFRMADSSRWTPATPAAIEADVRAIREMRSPHLRFPLQLVVDIPATKQIHGVPTARLRLALTDLLRGASAVLSWRPFTGTPDRPRRPQVRVKVAVDRIVASPSGLGGMVLHLDGSYAPTVETLAADLVTGAALCLANLGHAVGASSLLRLSWSRSTWSDSLDAANVAANALATAGAHGEGLALYGPHLNRRETAGPAFEMLTPFLARTNALSDADLRIVTELLSTAAEQAGQRGECSIAATFAYSAANVALRALDVSAAYDHFAAAARHDERYLERPYYLRELAGVEFLLGHFEQAANRYGRAIEIGESTGAVVALHADALFFAGRFLEAAERWDYYLADKAWTRDLAEWRLKRAAVGIVMRRLGANQQHRPATPDGFAGELAPDGSSVSPDDALRRDALDGVAWYNLALDAGDRDDPDFMFENWLVSVTLRPWVLEGWGAVLLLTTVVGADELLPDLLAFGYLEHGEHFLPSLTSLAPSLAELCTLFAEILASLPEPDPTPFTLRIHGSTSWEELRVPQ
jgi:tetratricopeptide (TPR) repeat protein